MDGPPPPPPPHGSNPRSSPNGANSNSNGGGSGGSSGLPPGNYDIFIIPPHSAGGGFIYLPSLRPERNSFLAGVACTAAAFWLWSNVEPTVKEWFRSVKNQGGSGVLVLVVIVAGVAWVLGKTQVAGGGGGGSHGPGGHGAGGAGGGFGAGYHQSSPPPQGGAYGGGAPPPRSGAQGAGPGAGAGYGGQHHYQQAPPNGEQKPKPSWGNQKASEGWERAREETRRREEERKRQEEEKRKQEEEKKKREEAERQTRAAAEKEKWEKMRQREKEAREREARERIAREKLAKEKDAASAAEAAEAAMKAKIEREVREKLEAEQRAKGGAEEDKDKLAREREERVKAARERVEKLAKERSVFGVGERTNPYEGAAPSVRAANARNSTSNYEKPSAKSYFETDEEMHSFRPYDEPKRPAGKAAKSVFSDTPSSYAPSATTARTTPPPSQRGPYTTSDPDKVVIKAVYLYNDLFPKPIAQLIAGIGNVTDGLILRITTEGLFIDDDVRGVPQREWDIKAWTMKLVEEGTRSGNHVLRASIRDPDGKKYVFVLAEEESWKVVRGLQRLKRGTQVRSMGQNGLTTADTAKILAQLGYG